MNIYPPYWATGIHLDYISQDWKELTVSMKLRWYNKNAVGSHFGGSLYSMIDPHLMLMVMQLLGKDYIVWDKSAQIEYVSAAKTKVTAKICLTDKDIELIKQQTSSGVKYLPSFDIMILDESSNLVAKVQKTLYVRRKQKN